jgi:glutathione S-transferase
MHKLYFSPNSCSLAPHIVLEEIGKPYEAELIQTGPGGKTRSPEWHAINPKGRVPALTNVPGSNGGAANVLTEVPAILNYLADAHPESGLAPADLAGRARANEWMNWLSSNVHAMSFGQIWRPHRFVDDESHYAALEQAGRSRLAQQYDYIESLLADGRDWAVPGGYSIVDPYLLVFWRWGSRVGLDMSVYPSWRNLMSRVAVRPAVRSVMERTGITAEL